MGHEKDRQNRVCIVDFLEFDPITFASSVRPKTQYFNP